MKRLFFIILVLGANMGAVFGFSKVLHARNWCPLLISGHPAVRNASFSASKNNRSAQWYVTESGYLAAVEEELLDRAIFWAGMGDEEEFMRFIASTDLVFPLKGGLRVSVEKFSFSGKVKIRPEGSDIAVWTIREAIRSELPASGT